MSDELQLEGEWTLGRCKLVGNFRVGLLTAQACQFCDTLFIFEKPNTELKALIDGDGEETKRLPFNCPGKKEGNSFSQGGEEIHVTRNARLIYQVLAPGGSVQIRRPG